VKKEMFALKGTCIYSKSKEILQITDGYVISDNGISQGIYEELPQEYKDITVYDYTGKLIIPGLIDLHLHAPQYPFRSTGMDLELLEWLNTYTFPEEAKYSDIEYASKAYSIFVEDLMNSPTTRACIFGTIHRESTLILMDMLEATGMKTMVGKVNMDRNCPDYLREESSEKSIADTIRFIEQSIKNYTNTVPILTPRFIPTCSDELMKSLGKLKEKYKLSLQSHLSENHSEIEWVKQLHPDVEVYACAYEKLDSFHPAGKTIMAHCIYLTEKEEELLKSRNVYIAHCPESNMNLSSGIAPIRKFMNKDLYIGLGSDIAAGSSVNLFRAMSYAIQSSKMHWRLVDSSCIPLTMEEVFYMATKGGGSFWGKVGSLEKGYQMDAIVLSDDNIQVLELLSPKERLERLIYLGTNENIAAKLVSGKRIGESN
jgi:guanine deaminase